jgi:hypothetical protein
MEWEIKSEEDETFTIKSKKMGEVAIASDGKHSAIGATEEDAVKAVEEMQEAPQKTKLAAPLENPKGLGWFDGTSWGTK